MTGPITSCQSCSSPSLDLVISLGPLPPCNDLRPINEPAREQRCYPTDLYFCPRCELGQLGYVPPQTETFPASYPYTSSTTRILRENFEALADEVSTILPLRDTDLVVDIGGNDGNLLSNFANHRTLNVTPEDVGRLGVERGIPHVQKYWTSEVAKELSATHGRAKLITATNVFAHVPDPHDLLEGVRTMLAAGGIFVSESHYFPGLLRDVQFDTIYAEHARYLSLTSIRHQLEAHGFSVLFARLINTHGGSVRVYAVRKDEDWSTAALRMQKAHPQRAVYADEITRVDLERFRGNTVRVKHELWRLLTDIKRLGLTVAGIGAPSRAGTLVSYCGLRESELDYVTEISGSHKIQKFMPGTRIPVVNEDECVEGARAWPDFALLLSHHVGGELMRKMREKGFRGKFIVPIPEPRVVG